MFHDVRPGRAFRVPGRPDVMMFYNRGYKGTVEMIRVHPGPDHIQGLRVWAAVRLTSDVVKPLAEPMTCGGGRVVLESWGPQILIYNLKSADGKE